MDCDQQLTAPARERGVPPRARVFFLWVGMGGSGWRGATPDSRHWRSLCRVVLLSLCRLVLRALVLHCDRVPFTLLCACKFSAALAIQPITAKEL